jgi:sugar phosphate isomerase/epimerase
MAHAFGRKPLQQLAYEVSHAGFGTVQLALARAVSDITCTPGSLSPGLANHIGEAFHRNGVRIAVLSCNIDPIHLDSNERRQNIRKFKEYLRYCRDFGCSVVATNTGKLCTYRSDFPDDYEKKAWGILRHSLYELAEEAEKWGVFVGIEPAASLVIHNSEGMHRMLEEVPSTTLGVVLDPCNLIHTGTVDKQNESIEEAFSLLANRIVAFHVKDAGIRSQDFTRTPAILGEGDFNVPLFLSLAKKYKPFADMMLAGIEGEQQIRQSMDYFQQEWEAAHS